MKTCATYLFKTRLFLIVTVMLFLGISCNNNRKTMPINNLVGLWKSESNLVFYEKWEQLPDSSFAGKGFSINGPDTIFSESMRIANVNDTLCYFATVYKQNQAKEIIFKLVERKRKAWIFENRTHDYPNRIIYKMETDSTLCARTENMKGNKPIEFRFKKVSR